MKRISALKFDPDLSIFHHDDGSVSSLELLDLPDQYSDTPDCKEENRYHPTPNSLVQRKIFITFLMGPSDADKMNKILFSENSSSLNVMSADVTANKEQTITSSLTNVTEMTNICNFIENINVTSPRVDKYSSKIKSYDRDECSCATPRLLESSDSDSARSEGKAVTCVVTNEDRTSVIDQNTISIAEPGSNTHMTLMKNHSSPHVSRASRLKAIFRPRWVTLTQCQERMKLSDELNDFSKNIQNSYDDDVVVVDDDDDSLVTSVQLNSELDKVQEKVVIENMQTLRLKQSFSSSSSSSKKYPTVISALNKEPIMSYPLSVKPNQTSHVRSQSLTLPTVTPLPMPNINRSQSDTTALKPSKDSNHSTALQVKERAKEKLKKRALISRLFSKKSKTKNMNAAMKNDSMNRDRLFSDSSTDHGASYPIVHMVSVKNKNSCIYETPDKHSRSRSMTELPKKDVPIRIIQTNDSFPLVSPLRNESTTPNQIFRHRRTISLPITLSDKESASRMSSGSLNRHESSASSDISLVSDSISMSSLKRVTKRSHNRQASISSVASDISNMSDSISVASSYVSYHDPCAKPSKIVKRSGIDLGAGDRDIWFEKIFISKRTGKKRTFFVSLATGKKKCDEPPTGASKVLYLEDLEDLRDLNITLPSEPPKIKRFSSC